MPKYTVLRDTDSTSVYIDENDRHTLPGRPHFGICDYIVLLFVYLFWVISLPVSWWCSFKIIPQYQRVIVFRLGRILPLKGPGLIVVIPCVDNLKRIDMRTRAFKVPPKQITTIDKGVLKVGADIQYRYADPILTQSIQNLDHSLRVTGEAAMNTILSIEKLSFIKNEKTFLHQKLQAHMNKVASGWGIEISRFELEHSTVMKGSGGVDPNEPEVDGGAMIMNLVKSVMSSQSTSFPNATNIMGMQNLGISPELTSSSSANQPTKLLSPGELFCLAKGIVDEDVCQHVSAIFEFQVTDCQGVTKIWNADLKNSPGFISDGKITSKIDVSFSANANTFQSLFYGKISPIDAYMNGSLVVKGDLNCAKKLEYLLLKLQSL